MVFKKNWFLFLMSWMVILISPIKMWAVGLCSEALQSNKESSSSEGGDLLSEWSALINELVELISPSATST